MPRFLHRVRPGVYCFVGLAFGWLVLVEGVLVDLVRLAVEEAVGYLEFSFPLQFDAVVDLTSKLCESLVLSVDPMLSVLFRLGDSPSEIDCGEVAWLMVFCCCC